MRLYAAATLVLAGLVGPAADAQLRRSPPAPADNSALIAATAEAAVGCAVAATPTGVDGARFGNSSEWVATSEPLGFRHSSLPIIITFPAEAGAPARRCLVEATLASQGDQAQLAAALGVLLPGPPQVEDDRTLWRIGRSPNGRSLLMVRDPAGLQPVIRFTGIAF